LRDLVGTADVDVAENLSLNCDIRRERVPRQGVVLGGCVVFVFVLSRRGRGIRRRLGSGRSRGPRGARSALRGVPGVIGDWHRHVPLYAQRHFLRAQGIRIRIEWRAFRAGRGLPSAPKWTVSDGFLTIRLINKQ